MTDSEKLLGTWRLLGISKDGETKPERGAKPTGFLTYHRSGLMHVVIHPDRPPIEVKGTVTPQQALDALWGYTSYFGTYTVDEAKKIVTHHRTGSVQPGWQAQKDFLRWYRFDTPDQITPGGLDAGNELVWERLK